MNRLLWSAFVGLASLLAPVPALGQSAEHEDVEVIEPPTGKVPEQKADLSKVTRLIVERTNAFRTEQGQKPVKTADKLTAAAQAFAEYMAKTDHYGHTADGRRPAQRAKAKGYEYCIVLENIAYQFNSRGIETEKLAERFVQGWKDSPGHRKNMLDPDVTQTGVGLARSDKSGYYYAVQMFGRPKSASIRFRVANRSGMEVSYSLGDKKFQLGPRYTRTHTRCRPTELKFLSAGDDKGAKTFEPSGGERFVLTARGEGYAVTKEREKR